MKMSIYPFWACCTRQLTFSLLDSNQCLHSNVTLGIQMLRLPGNESCWLSWLSTHTSIYLSTQISQEVQSENSCLLLNESTSLWQGFRIIMFTVVWLMTTHGDSSLSLNHKRWSDFSKADKRKNHLRKKICRQKQPPKKRRTLVFFSWVITPTEQTHSFDISNIKYQSNYAIILTNNDRLASGGAWN